MYCVSSNPAISPDLVDREVVVVEGMSEAVLEGYTQVYVLSYGQRRIRRARQMAGIDHR